MVDFVPHFGKTCARHSDWKYIDLSAMKVLIIDLFSECAINAIQII